MSQVFFATATPILTLFVCIAVGFTVRKANIVDRTASKTVSKLVTWVFCPALNFSTMAKNFTVQTLSTHAANLTVAVLMVAVALLIAIPLARVFVPQKGPERGIYTYALAFANSTYMGDPVILMLFGEQAFTYYKLFSLPCLITIYSWGMTQLVPRQAGRKGFWRSILNAPIVAMLIGMAFGIAGLGAYLPEFVTKSLDTLKVCVGPGAMLVAGFTIANYSIGAMLKKGKVYIASILRLTVIPAVLVAAAYGIKLAANHLFGLDIGNNVLYLVFTLTAMPLGLNTVVFPESYGGDPSTGASMAMISHTMCVVTIPLMYSLMTLIFGPAMF